MSSSQHSQTLLLPDGRTLGYAAYGATTSYTSTILYSHGVPGSRLEAAYLSANASLLKTRIISIDRPGIGLSSPFPSRRILDYPADAAALITHLSLHEEGYYLLGFSGGAAYTFACALLLPHSQIRGIGIIAGIGPWDIAVRSMSFAQRASGCLATYLPGMTEWMMDCSIGRAARAYPSDPGAFEHVIRRGIDGLDEFTKATLKKDKVTMDIFTENLRETYSASTRAVLDDARLLVGDWGFRLQDLPVLKKGRVKMWYGTADQNCRLEMGREMAKLLPGAKMHELKGQTHFAVVPNRGKEILEQLVGR